MGAWRLTCTISRYERQYYSSRLGWYVDYNVGFPCYLAMRGEKKHTLFQIRAVIKHLGCTAAEAVTSDPLLPPEWVRSWIPGKTAEISRAQIMKDLVNHDRSLDFIPVKWDHCKVWSRKWLDLIYKDHLGSKSLITSPGRKKSMAQEKQQGLSLQR